MMDGIEVTSVATSVASGLLVALLVEGVVHLRIYQRRRSSISSLRGFFLDFKKQFLEVRGAEDGAYTREAAKFVLWKAHLNDAPDVLSSHAPYLRREQFLEVMGIINGHQRLVDIIPENQFPISETPMGNPYRQYFDRLGALHWLKLDAEGNAAKLGRWWRRARCTFSRRS